VLVETDPDRAWWLTPLDAAEHLADVRRLTPHPARDVSPAGNLVRIQELR